MQPAIGNGVSLGDGTSALHVMTKKAPANHITSQTPYSLPKDGNNAPIYRLRFLEAVTDLNETQVDHSDLSRKGGTAGCNLILNSIR